MNNNIKRMTLLCLLLPFVSYANIAIPIDSKQHKTSWEQDSFDAMRFERQETHGYRWRHGYDREDEGTVQANQGSYGYTWDSSRNHWHEEAYSDWGRYKSDN